MKPYLITLAFLILFYTSKKEVKPKIEFNSSSFELIKEKDSLVIYGKIKDNIGESFKYVNIHIQDSNLKIKVDEKGNYKTNVFQILNEKNELTIIFSFLGYKTEKRKITKKSFNKNNKLEINIKLKEDIAIIECPTG
jgi:hypothetical protein